MTRSKVPLYSLLPTLAQKSLQTNAPGFRLYRLGIAFFRTADRYLLLYGAAGTGVKAGTVRLLRLGVPAKEPPPLPTYHWSDNRRVRRASLWPQTAHSRSRS
jgi:hypothetical protein